MPLPLPLLRLRYYDAAQAYLRSLPPEHFMEAVPQATQRKITLESLDLVHAARPEVQVFNELLVQYPRPDDEIGQVVPDNMVVVWEQPIEADGSFDIPTQPCGLFWVLEYVSKSSKRKDYEDNMQKYERELKVPYYLLFVPDVLELELFQRKRSRYVSVKPNREGRLALPELELEMCLLDGWVRFWFRGRLLPLPAELQNELEQTRQLLNEERQRAEDALRRLDQEQQSRAALEQELTQLRAQLEQLRSPRED
jgi:Uma2 family endonuclease